MQVKTAPVEDTGEYVGRIESRRSIDLLPQVEGRVTKIGVLPVFGGMIVSTILNLVFIPVLYVLFRSWRASAVGPPGDRPEPRSTSQGQAS